jgi:anti-anti-sigma factor
MKVSAQDHGHISVLTISGEFTTEDVDHFQRILAERITAGAVHILLDCEHLEFVDSVGLESWLRARDEVSAGGGQFRLIALDENVRKILEITRLSKAIESHDSLELAVRSVR